MTNEEFIAYLNTASCRESIIEHAKKLVAVAEAAKNLLNDNESFSALDSLEYALEKLEEK